MTGSGRFPSSNRSLPMTATAAQPTLDSVNALSQPRVIADFKYTSYPVVRSARAASQPSIACLRAAPQRYCPLSPLPRITRWQGIR